MQNVPSSKKEKIMEHRQIAGQVRGASFDTVAKADQAIRQLRAAGFSDNQLLTACPTKFKDECACAMPASDSSKVSVGETIGKGAVTGAAIGGLALVGAVLTGGLSAAGAALLVGGSALAGGFSNLIVTKGYQVEAPEFVHKAIRADRIVVDVEVRDDHPDNRLAEVQRILDEAGGEQLGPM
jgi:hypothetical protein